MNDKGIIYKATSPSGNSYIGQTVQNLEKRIKGHYEDSRICTYAFANALRKYKKEELWWTVLYIDIPIKQLDNMERWCIANYDTYNNGYNSTFGGEDNPMHYGEFRNKVAESKRGKTRKPFSDEWKANISKGQIGKKMPDGFGSGTKNSMYGKTRSDVSERNRSNPPMLGKTFTKEHKYKLAFALAKTYKIIKPNGDIEVIKNLSKYCKENNLNNKNMNAVANKKRKQHKGYKCEKIEKIEETED